MVISGPEGTTIFVVPFFYGPAWEYKKKGMTDAYEKKKLVCGAGTYVVDVYTGGLRRLK